MDQNQESAENPAAGVDASALAGGLSSSQKRDMARFNIVKAIREARTGKLTGVEAEMNQEGLAERRRLGLDTRDAQMGAIHLPDFLNKEMRTNTVTGGTGGNLGGDLVYTDPGRYVDFLYPNTPMLGLCSVAENLVGNVQFPVQDTDYTLNWNTETGAASAQDLTFSTITMTPKRSVIAAAVSNQLLAQEYSQGIQARMINQLNQSFNKGLEQAVLTGTGASNQPTGSGSLILNLYGQPVNLVSSSSLATAGVTSSSLAFLRLLMTGGLWLLFLWYLFWRGTALLDRFRRFI